LIVGVGMVFMFVSRGAMIEVSKSEGLFSEVAEAEGTVLIEGIHQTFAHAIIDNPESATDAGFAVLRARSPGKSNARAKIMSIPIVVTRFAVGASAQS